MKTLIFFLLFLGCLFSDFTGRAQFNPDKICRIDDRQLIFTINLNWTEKEKQELINLFDLDSTLVSQVFAGKTNIQYEGETWMVKKLKAPLVELSKPLQTTEEAYENDVFLMIDQWINFAGNNTTTPVIWGYNNYKAANVFLYNNGQVWLFLPGYTHAQQVYIAGSFNNWKTNGTPMNRVSTGWSVILPLPPDKYTYKYIVDGHWITDPVNNQKEDDREGNKNSVFYCTNHNFELKGFLKAKKVVVTGNFYNWNPKGLAMNRNSSGWSLPVFLRDGTYAYKFLVDNQWMIDPENPLKRKDANRNENSFLEIGEPFTFQLEGFTQAKNVILTGSFNNWNETELLMQKTAEGWQLSYVVAPGNYEYKFIVDGKWIHDPGNPFTSGTGNYINSLISLKANHFFELDGHIDAKNVIVTGSFNGWNRDGYQMSQQEGKWFLPLYLAPGKYTYKFIVDGSWILDPSNKLYEENEYGTDNSVLWIEN